MNTLFKLGHAVTHHLVRGVLVALLVSQFAWADHFHLELEQNAGCSVCAFVDNSPAVAGVDAAIPLVLASRDYQPLQRTEDPLSPPSFNHHSRAPPAH